MKSHLLLTKAKRLTVIAAFAHLITCVTAHCQGLQTHISMTVGDVVISATLEDSETTREFIATLPRTISMTRYDDREYYGKVGKRLSEDGPQIPDYSDGDITYYVPGGSFAVFFDKEEESSLSGLIRMGRVESDLSVFSGLAHNVDMRIAVEKELAPSV